MRGLGLALAIVVASAGSARADEDTPAMLALEVDHVARGDAAVVLRGDDVLVRVADLEAAGIHAIAGTQETIDGERMVSLASLRGVKFVFDRDDLALSIEAAPELLPHTVIDLHEGRPSGLVVARDSSAWVNYAVTGGSGGALALSGEAGASIGGSLLYTGVTRPDGGPTVRTASSWTVDWPDLLVRGVFGDSFASAGGLGGGAFIGGLSLGTSFALDPYFVQYPGLKLQGATYAPSEVDVYVNGTLVRREQLAPGQFTLQNVPVVAGNDSTRMVIRDAYGREQTIDSSYYFSTGVLKPGLADFSVNVGAERDNVATDSFDYSRPVFVARYRRGLTDWLTPGAHFEMRDSLAAGGAGVTMRLPVGELALEGAANREAQARAGAAASLTYTYADQRASAGAAVRATSDTYATLATAASDDRATLQAQLFAGTHLGRLGLSAELVAARMRDTGTSDQAQLTANTVVGGLLVTATATYTIASATGRDVELFAGLTLPLGPRTTASVFGTQHGGATSAQASLVRSLPAAPGYGYDLETSAGPTAAASSVQAGGLYQTSFGRYEAHASDIAGSYGYSATASGGLVAIGGRVIATRAVQDGFALVQVPDVEGVKVKLDNVDLGTTDRDGDLLIPTLVPYYGSRISIDAAGIPLDHAVDATDLLVAAPFRGGALARFPVRELKSASGSVVVAIGGERVVPRFGELVVTVRGNDHTSPIGNAGEFYLDDLAAGTYDARIDYERGTCRFALHVLASKDAIVDLGQVTCKDKP
ncbi:MAG TPA: fimbria/pilus outer membrane usher protein [Kofleriaceae bacterium]|nr:fimbria/pilus outer membrane usher protein [Kofleriaceae bacterium]